MNANEALAIFFSVAVASWAVYGIAVERRKTNQWRAFYEHTPATKGILPPDYYWVNDEVEEKAPEIQEEEANNV